MRLGLFLSMLLGCCSGMLACTHPDSVPQSSAAPALALSAAVSLPRAPAAPMPASERQAASIYDLRVPLRDDTGTIRTLDTFRGHPVLITMFYGTCPIACPTLTSDLKRLQRQIPEPLRGDVRIVMVSFDAARDTPAALTQIKQERGLSTASWTLASTPDDEARELAGVLGIKYRKLDNGVFFHSSVIVLLDREGRPQARIEGAGGDASAMLAMLSTPSI